MNYRINPIASCVIAIAAVAVLCASSPAQAGVISVNFRASGTVDAQNIDSDETFGIASLGTVVGGWLNISNAFNNLTDSEGNATTVNLINVLQPAGTAAIVGAAYADTPLYSGFDDYVATATPTGVTLANLAANFPNGYKVIVYVGGFITCSNASISDGTTTFYYSPTNDISTPFPFAQITNTINPGNAKAPVGQYVVFGEPTLLTANSITLVQNTLYGGGSVLGGLQIVGTSVNDPIPRLLTSEGFNASGYNIGDSLIKNDTLGYGFDGPWTGYGSQVKILSNSLAYAGYGEDGGRRVQVATNSAIRRQFLTGNNGPLGNYLNTNGLISISRDKLPLYLAFLMYSSTNQPGGNFSLYNSNYATSNRFFMVQLQTANPFPITAAMPANGIPQTLGNNNNGVNLVVARFDFAGTNGTVKVWLNPSTSGPEPVADATFTNLDIAFDRLQLTYGFATGAVEFDEIRFGNDWASTVSSNGLATLPGVQTLVGMRGLPPSPLGGTNYPREFFPFVDAFGQYRHLEWSNKVHSVAELQQSATNELADLAANPGPEQWCEYGGWLNGPQLTATGMFRVQKYQGDWWFVDPHGHLFWSHGATGVEGPGVATGVTDRENYFANLPLPGDADSQFLKNNSKLVSGGYYAGSKPLTMDYMAANALRKYGTNWADYSLDLNHTRLRSWGMNSIGSWTTTNVYLERRTPYARFFNPFVDAINGDSRMPDYFNPAFATALTNSLSGPERNDPWCLGVYINNEPDWARASGISAIKYVGLTTLAATNTSFAKAAFRDQLQTAYGTIGALNAQWGTSYSSWADFLNQQSTFPSGTNGDTDLNAFYRNYAEQFFRTCADVIHGYTSNLFLGSRFAGRTTFVEAAQACTNYVDVASFNSYYDTLSVLTGLEADIPLLNTEHNFCAKDTGLFWGGLNTVASQAERASGYTNHFNSAINSARFVGQHWFQFKDRSTTAILDSDEDGNNNNGLVDVADQPYPLLIAAVRKTGYSIYSARLGTTPPTISAITNRTIPVNSNTGPIAFKIGDDLTAVGSLLLSKDCSNTNLIPLNNIVLGGSGTNRTVTITPRTNYAGAATITLTVTDGKGARGFTSFAVTVVPSAPALSNFALSNQLFRVTITGNAGVDYFIQASTNLIHWQPVFTNLNATPPLVWTEPQTTNFPRRFYRVLLGP